MVVDHRLVTGGNDRLASRLMTARLVGTSEENVLPYGQLDLLNSIDVDELEGEKIHH